MCNSCVINCKSVVDRVASFPGVGVEGAGCECTDLLLSASAALLRQHFLRGLGS